MIATKVLLSLLLPPVKVTLKGDAVVISLRDKDYIQRIFSSKPADVLIKVKIPGDPDISETVSGDI